MVEGPSLEWPVLRVEPQAVPQAVQEPRVFEKMLWFLLPSRRRRSSQNRNPREANNWWRHPGNVGIGWSGDPWECLCPGEAAPLTFVMGIAMVTLRSLAPAATESDMTALYKKLKDCAASNSLGHPEFSSIYS